ncbi:aldose 1-epimerase [Pseudomonas daroniae]|uniref:Aldose 1-epimerase n=1 Tax=Phytopseudomonas daroniae TaxID=2487519 RepID=A0A4Q9QMA1_9GAMM|nr:MULTISPECIES: aldose 1-epimerase [Pseudomonas]TBU80687.1 aldose 1-epimerase [Pseudomonas daroniae]TBU81722.1 aldose 1-epimerase [Pseudomonas sp. FRB 228]TBU90712.1 aldose 1-epimerase [Pseudomonas daroniae]
MPLDTLHLQDRFTRLTLAPQTGGSIANWTVKDSGQPLLRPSDEQALQAGTPRRLGCYPLAPWSNRISDGGFDNPQGWLALEANADNSPMPIHGSAWQQPWQVVEHNEVSALLRLESQIPFAYIAQQRIRLHEGRLDIHLQVTHMADAPMWHGLGLHPYFPRLPNTRLQARAEQVWQCGSDSLPTHLSELPADWNFAEERDLPLQHTDNAFTDWNGQARILQPDAGYSLDISAEGSGLYLLFCPEQMPFFCFEPVSHPVNAHHMPGKPGLVLLCRGQSHSLTFSLQYNPLT